MFFTRPRWAVSCFFELCWQHISTQASGLGSCLSTLHQTSTSLCTSSWYFFSTVLLKLEMHATGGDAQPASLCTKNGTHLRGLVLVSLGLQQNARNLQLCLLELQRNTACDPSASSRCCSSLPNCCDAFQAVSSITSTEQQICTTCLWLGLFQDEPSITLYYFAVPRRKEVPVQATSSQIAN